MSNRASDSVRVGRTCSIAPLSGAIKQVGSAWHAAADASDDAAAQADARPARLRRAGGAGAAGPAEL